MVIGIKKIVTLNHCHGFSQQGVGTDANKLINCVFELFILTGLVSS